MLLPRSHSMHGKGGAASTAAGAGFVQRCLCPAAVNACLFVEVHT